MVGALLVQLHELTAEYRRDCTQGHEDKRRDSDCLHALILRLHHLAVALRDCIERQLDDVGDARVQARKPPLGGFEESFAVH